MGKEGPFCFRGKGKKLVTTEKKDTKPVSEKRNEKKGGPPIRFTSREEVFREKQGGEDMIYEGGRCRVKRPCRKKRGEWHLLLR